LRGTKVKINLTSQNDSWHTDSRNDAGKKFLKTPGAETAPRNENKL